MRKVGPLLCGVHGGAVNTSRTTSLRSSAATVGSSCVVCAERDERALSTLKLVDGTRVFVCGSHDLIYRRSGVTASTIEELRAVARDRRENTARRDEGDELGVRLTAAFSADKRSGHERRR
jgi:hypothetical protein